MRKKGAVFFGSLLILLFFAVFCGCARSAAQTPASLLRALEKEAPAYTFPAEGLLYKDGVWFAFYSLHEPNDLLLTLRTDKRQTVVRAAVTAKRGSEAANRELAPFGVLLSRLLLGEDCDTDLLAAATGLALLPQTPVDIVNIYETGGDRAVLFCGAHALCFSVELRGFLKSELTEGISDSREAVSFSADGDTVSGENETDSSESENFSAESEYFSEETENFSSEIP